MKSTASKLFLPLLAAFTLVLIAGCRVDRTGEAPVDPPVDVAQPDAPPADPDPADLPPDPVFELMQQVERLIEQEQAGAAKELLSEALGNPEFEAHRPRLFFMTLATLVMIDEVEEAKSRMYAMLQADMETARESIGVITEHLLMSDDRDAVMDWTETLLHFDLPAPTRNAVLNWRLQALLQGILQRAIGPDHAPVDPRAHHRRVTMANFVDTLLRSVPEEHRLAALSHARDMLGADVPAAEDWEPLREEITLRRALLEQEWDNAIARLQSARGMLADATMQRLLRAAIGDMTNAGALDRVDDLTETLMTFNETHPRAAQAATLQWVRNAVQQGRLAAVPERIELLMEQGADDQLLHSLFNRHFYDIIGEPEVVGRMLTLADRLLERIADERQQQTLRILSLDGSFVTQDYDRTIALLEEGIPGRDADWHALALTKVKAHRAIDNDEPLEAVNHLRAFMEAVRRSPEESTADPTTGIVHTRSMILGRNASRIGDLLTQAGEVEGARQAYDQARAYYEQALEALDPDSPSAELAQREMEQIP